VPARSAPKNLNLVGLRMARDLTQTQVAVGMQRVFARAGRKVPPLDKGFVYRWEAGAGISDRYLWALCVLFDATPAELGFPGRPDARRHDDRLLAPMEERNVPTRRDMFRAAGAIGTAMAVPEWAHRLADQIGRALEDRKLIDLPLLADFTTATGAFRQRFAHEPPAELLGPVKQHLVEVASLLERPHLRMHHRQLCVIAGRLAGLAGRLSVDLNDHRSAHAYFQTGLRVAQEADDRPLTAYLLEATTWLPANSRPQVKAAILEHASQLAATATASERGFMASRTAQEHAEAGNAGAAMRWLEQAEAATQELTRDGSADGSGWESQWNESYLLRYEGNVQLNLGDGARAKQLLHEASRRMPASAVRSHSILMPDLAGAYVQEGEPEEACRIAADGIELVAEMPATAALTGLRRLRANLRPVERLSAVRELDERLAVL
jgi:hypothetical protein